MQSNDIWPHRLELEKIDSLILTYLRMVNYERICKFYLRVAQLSRTSLIAQSVKNLARVQETWVDSWFGKILWRRKWLPTPVFLLGESRGPCSPWDCKSQTLTQRLNHYHQVSRVSLGVYMIFLNDYYMFKKLITDIQEIWPIFRILVGLEIIFVFLQSNLFIFQEKESEVYRQISQQQSWN